MPGPGLEGVMLLRDGCYFSSDVQYFPGFAFRDQKAENKDWKK